MGKDALKRVVKQAIQDLQHYDKVVSSKRSERISAMGGGEKRSDLAVKYDEFRSKYFSHIKEHLHLKLGLTAVRTMQTNSRWAELLGDLSECTFLHNEIPPEILKKYNSSSSSLKI
jgi:hypothetical protein